jgi:FixJ family two-component response regulator
VRESLPDLLRQLGFATEAFSSAEAFLASDVVGETGCLVLDVAKFLTKPFKDKVLLNAIRGAIERSRTALRQDSEMQVLRDCYVHSLRANAR